jgi:hypothetical protein
MHSKFKSSTGTVSGDQRFEHVFCDGYEDFAITGGYDDRDVGTEITKSAPYVEALSNGTPYGWQVRWKNDASTDTITLSVVCADVGTPRQ